MEARLFCRSVVFEKAFGGSGEMSVVTRSWQGSDLPGSNRPAWLCSAISQLSRGGAGCFGRAAEE